MSKFTKRITAMLLSGMLAIGSATGSVYAAAADVDPGLTSEIAEEVFTEEPVETSEAPVESAQTSEVAEEVFPEEGTAETSVTPVDPDQSSEKSEEVFTEEEATESSEAMVDPDQVYVEAPQEEVVTSYTVTLDANGGYFVNEWDDSIGSYVEQAEVVVKQIPVGGAVAAVPVYADQDGQSMVFAGWSLVRNGEIVSSGDEEYAPVENSVLYAVWEYGKSTKDNSAYSHVIGEDALLNNAAEQAIENGTNNGIEDDAEDFDNNDENLENSNIDNYKNNVKAIGVQEEMFVESGDQETVATDASMNIRASGTCGDSLYWTLDWEGTLTISGTGAMTRSPWRPDNKYYIKKVIIDDKVTNISDNAFESCYEITSVTIPSSVMSIGVNAFRYCCNLSSVIIPSSVKVIGDYAFDSCNLESVEIHEGVQSIGKCAFRFCTNLKNVILPSSITSIGKSAFTNSGLVSVTLPNGITSIEESTFWGCNLTSVIIPESVTNIEIDAFGYCESLDSIIVDDKNTRFSSSDGVLFNKNQDVLICCPGGKGGSYCIPDSVTRIEKEAFAYCLKLTGVKMTDNITEIDTGTFRGCIDLTSVILSNNLDKIGSEAFEGCTSLVSVILPSHVFDIDDSFVHCTGLNNIYFKGKAPIISSLYGVTATAYYPADDPTWTEDVRQNYGGTITWVEWDPTSSGEDEKLKIVSTTPTNGDLNVDHALDYFSIQFNEFIAYGNEGYAYLYDASNGSSPVARALIGLGDEEHDNDQSLITGGNTLKIHFPFDVELGHEYYIKIDADCIKKDTSDINEEGEATEEVYFKGITDNQSWRFKICAVDYMHFGNPTDSIHESAYHVLFTPIKASYIKMIDNGSEGTCFGWSYAVGAKASGYDGINGFGKELKSLEKNSLYGTTDFSFLEYIQYAQLYQNTLDKTIEKWSTENKYNDIFNAIKASINGTGPKIVVNVYGKGGHAVYPLSILEENDSEVLIRVINPNEDFVTGSHYSTLTLKKKDGVINGFEMEGYNKRISYSTVDEVIDDVFSLASEYISDTNMVHSSVPISDSDYYELEPCGEDGTNIQDTHLYWYEGAQVNTSLSADGQIGITDGYKDISVTVGDNADINLNLDEMSAVVESSSDIPSEYEISYKEAISADNIETITVSSSTAGELMGQKTSEGIVVQSSGSEDINVYTDDLSIKASTNGDSVLIKADNNNGIEVLKDPDGDGEYDEQVPVETLSENRIQLVESMVSGIQGKKYTGKEIKQEIILTNENTILDEGADYEVSYTDNINVGTATVTITGKGNYTGIVSKTFTISAVSIANATITGISNRTYTGSAIIQNPTVKVGDQTLTKDTDYTISYANNTKVGTATVKITGKDNYTGTVSKTFKINGIPVSNATVSGISNKTYTGSAITQNPTVKVGDKTLKKGTDYTVSYANNTNVGTATVTITGKGNYASKKTATFKINKAAQSITAKAGASRVAVGKTTTVSITGNKGKKSYKSSNTAIATVDSSTGKVTAKKVGTVKITATSAATANFKAASKTVTIKVVPAATASLTAANQVKGIKLTWKKVTGANGYKVYRGSTLIKTITSGSTVTFADIKANTNGTKYTYKIVAKATTGDSTLSKSVAVYRVARPAVSSVTNSAASKMTVKWGKNAKATGYQIQYSTDKTFKTGNKAVTVAGASAVSKVIGGLAKSKTYYVRIRTYKTVGSSKYWSVWSTAKGVKIKPVVIVKKGNCGKSIRWKLDSYGKLTIAGTGMIPDYYLNTPWPSKAIKTIVIEEGVIGIGKNVFYDCDTLLSVVIPASITKIGEDAFAWCNKLSSVKISKKLINDYAEAFKHTPWFNSKVNKELALKIYNRELKGRKGDFSLLYITNDNIPDLIFRNTPYDYILFVNGEFMESVCVGGPGTTLHFAYYPYKNFYKICEDNKYPSYYTVASKNRMIGCYKCLSAVSYGYYESFISDNDYGNYFNSDLNKWIADREITRKEFNSIKAKRADGVSEKQCKFIKYSNGNIR